MRDSSRSRSQSHMDISEINLEKVILEKTIRRNICVYKWMLSGNVYVLKTFFPQFPVLYDLIFELVDLGAFLGHNLQDE